MRGLGLGLGLAGVLRNIGAGVDTQGLGQMGLQSGIPDVDQGAYMDEGSDASDTDLPEDPAARYQNQHKFPSFRHQFPQSAVATPPVLPTKKTKKVTVRRLVTRNKTVYDRFPSFTPDRNLDWVELFGTRAKKPSRLTTKELPATRKASSTSA